MTDVAENKPQHPQVQIENVKLEPLEKAIYTHDYEQAGHLLIEMLRKLRGGAYFIGYRNEGKISEALHTRLAAAIFTLMADPEFLLSPEGFVALASEHAVFDMVFCQSGLLTSDHMVPLIADVLEVKDQKEFKFSDPVKLCKYLLTYTTSSNFGIRFDTILKQNPQLTFGLWCGMLAHLLVISPNAAKRRDELLGYSKLFENVELGDTMLPLLSDTYMYSSYGTCEHRHQLKGVVHRLCKAMMLRNGYVLPTAEALDLRRVRVRKAGKKPRMLIPLDWFNSLHAMFRCWAPPIRQLREHFYLIGASQQGVIDEQAKKEFDEWVEVPDKNIDLRILLDRMRDLEPDVIYYPSVGMSLWWVVMASLRLAPIQLMTLGHPASSQSPEMDYVVADAGTFCDESLFTETMVELPEGSLFNFTMRPDAEFPAPVPKEREPQVVRIAVPAMLCKLNARFLAVCQRIMQQSSVKTEFHFFPNMIGLTLRQTCKDIRQWLPEAFVHERTSFNDYLWHINHCDLHLCTFPFGGTNSNIDSMKLAVPLVAMEGKEPFERFDAIMLHKINWPEWAIAKSDDEYVAAAVRMIENGDERLALRNHLLVTPLDNVFFAEDAHGRFGKAVWKIFEEHESMRGQKWIKIEK